MRARGKMKAGRVIGDLMRRVMIDHKDGYSRINYFT